MRLCKEWGARFVLLGVVLVAALMAWPDVHQGFSLHYDEAVHLVTGSRAVRLAYPDPFAIYYTREPRDESHEAARLLAWYRQIGACWVVQEPMITEPGQITYYYRLIRALREASGGQLQEVYRAGDGWFAIYRLHGCPAA